MKMIPPAIRPKEARSSVGGRDGRMEIGGLRNNRAYVNDRAKAALKSRFPHCLCIIVEIIVDW